MEAAVCAKCGEKIEPGFDACWKCGSEIPAAEMEAASPSLPGLPEAGTVLLSTTATLDGYRIVRALDIVAAECAFDVDVPGSVAPGFEADSARNVSLREVLRAARLECLRELRQEASRLGANAVIAVSINYHGIASDGAPVTLLAACGTAVLTEPVAGTLPGADA